MNGVPNTFKSITYLYKIFDHSYLFYEVIVFWIPDNKTVLFWYLFEFHLIVIFIYSYFDYHEIGRWKPLSYCVSICLCINVTCLKPCMTRDNVTCWYNWHIHIYKTYIQLLCVHTSFKILRKMKKDNNSGFQMSQHYFIANPKHKHWIRHSKINKIYRILSIYFRR